MEESGSSKRKRRVSKKESIADPEDCHGKGPDKDKALRDNRNNCWIKVEDLICDVMNGDNSIRSTGPWNGRKEIVERVHKRLQDPLVLLRRVEKMEPSIMRDMNLKDAFERIELFLKRLKNPVTDLQESPDGIDGNKKTLQDCRKDLQSYKNQRMQENAVCDSEQQSADAAKAYVSVSALLSKMAESCCKKMYDGILDPSNPSRGNSVQIEGEQLVFCFPTSPNYTKGNLHGKNDENSNSGMINQEEPEKEVNFTVATVGEKVVKLSLKMSDNDLDVTLPNAQVSNLAIAQCDLDKLQVPGDLGEGTSNYVVNDANTVMSCVLDSRIRSYCINPCYTEVLDEIIQNHPNFDKKLLVENPYLHNLFMNALAEVYRCVESYGENFNFSQIVYAKSLVKDLEFNGMELSWMKEKLEPVSRIVITKVQKDHEDTERQLAMLKEVENYLTLK